LSSVIGAPGAVPTSDHARSFQLTSRGLFGPGTVSSMPNRGSPGRSLITKNQPGSSLAVVPPRATFALRSKPMK
jgi:hypothetical protein